MSKFSYVTEEGLQKLKDELDHLMNVERPLISKMIADARDKGDLSERKLLQFRGYWMNRKLIPAGFRFLIKSKSAIRKIMPLWHIQLYRKVKLT